MVNEAVLLRQYSLPVQFTCADGTGIEKGAILKLSDPNTAALSTAATDQIAGICAAEKIANDGVTKVAVYRDGEFKVYCSGSATVGLALSPCVSTDFPNYVMAAAVTASGSCVLGYALETAAAGETFRMRLAIGGGGGIA